jgi:hypothetical protein
MGLLGCGSLVQEVDPGKVPTTTAKLVVHSYISPQDTVLAVLVEAPRAILGQQANFNRVSIGNATVDLSDGTTTVRLPYVPKDGLYRISPRSLPIIAGRTYTLSVVAPNYPAVRAQCTVPAQVVPTEIRIDSIVQSQFEQQRQITPVGRLVWQDPGGQPNFYRVTGYSTRIVAIPNYPGPNGTTRDTTLTQVSSLRFDKPVALATDQGRDGSRFISPTATPAYFYTNQIERLLSLRFTMSLLTVDENYYRYHDAVDLQDNSGDNPFSEPVLIPSNIQNGLGCFGAFNQASLTVRVR